MTVSPGRKFLEALIDPDRLLVVPEKATPALRRRIVAEARKLRLKLERNDAVAHGEIQVSQNAHSLRIKQDLEITIDGWNLSSPNEPVVLRQELRFPPRTTGRKRRRAPLTQSNRRIWLVGPGASEKAPQLLEVLTRAGITARTSPVHRVPNRPQSRQRFAADPARVMVKFDENCSQHDLKRELSELLEIKRGDGPWHEAYVLKPLDPYALYEEFSRIVRERAKLSYHGLPLLLPLAAVPPDDDDYAVQQSTKLALIDAENMWRRVESLAATPGRLRPVIVYLIDCGVDACEDAPVDAAASVKIDESTGGWEFGCEPLNDDPHGTQMASIIGATWDGEHMAGITGVADAPITMISLRCASIDDVNRALGYAMAHAASVMATGVVVIGLDILGMYVCASGIPAFAADVATFRAELARVTTGAGEKLLVVVPSGNKDMADPDSLLVLPPLDLNLAGTVIVGACDDGRLRWEDSEFASRYSSDLTLLAPGDRIYTLVRGTPRDYDHASGTSFAAAHVAGVAALMRSIHTLAPDALKTKMAGCCFASASPPIQRGSGVIDGHRSVL